MSDASTPPKIPEKTAQEKIDGLATALGIPNIKQQMDDLNQTQNRILTELGNTNQNLNSALEWIRDFSSKINQAGGIPQKQESITPQGNIMQQMMGQGVSFKDVAEAIKALRGNDAPQQSEFAQLVQQMVTDLIRATVDDIQQRVYGLRKLPPPNLQGHVLE